MAQLRKAGAALTSGACPFGADVVPFQRPPWVVRPGQPAPPKEALRCQDDTHSRQQGATRSRTGAHNGRDRGKNRSRAGTHSWARTMPCSPWSQAFTTPDGIGQPRIARRHTVAHHGYCCRGHTTR